MRPRFSPSLALLLVLAVLGVLGYHYHTLLMHVAATTALAVLGAAAVWLFAVTVQKAIFWAWRRPIRPMPPPKGDPTIAEHADLLESDETLVVATVPGELPEINSSEDEKPLER